MKLKLAFLVAAALNANAVYAANGDTLSGLKKAVTDGKVNLNFRYRYEHVDQDGIDDTANASTLKTRLTWKSGDYKGFFTKVEVDNVTAIGGENYNSTVNGNTQYPVVVDPTDTDLNQAFIGYKSGNATFYAGRQRIVHGNQRFVGGVAWRQNEQTFDGYRVTYNDKKNLSVDYSYVYNVNRIFGPEGSRADLKGDIHLFNASYKFNKQHKANFYAYNMDFDTALALANRTFGASYDGKFDNFGVHLAFATQSDTGDNPTDYSTEYWNVEVNGKIANVTLGAGMESLGSDNGKGFVTPLATLHKFQGFADKFLATPGTGVEDVYLKAGTKFGKLAVSATWHDLSSDTGNVDYGTEIDLVAKYPLAKNVGLLVKYANFSADDFATDTEKFWAMLSLKF